MNAHEALARSLVDLGVDTAFGLIGDANLYAVRSLVEDHGVRFVHSTHEATGVMMADGWARVTGRVGVATTTHGPALTNTVTALTEATRARTPLLLIVGDTTPGDRQNLQSIDQRDVVRPTGAGFIRVTSAVSLVTDLARAFHRAASESRPIVLDIPVDLTWAEVDYEPPSLRPLPPAPAPSPDALDAAFGVVASARRPLLLAGRGAGCARKPLLRLADRIGAPVSTTLLAKGLFKGVDADLGVFGTLSAPVAVEAIAEADLVLAFGASLNKFTTSDGAFLAGRALVHVDVATSSIDRWTASTAAVIGDAGLTADQLDAMFNEADLPVSPFQADVARALVEDAGRVHHRDRSTPTSVDIRTAMVELDHMLPVERTVVCDAGRFLYQTLPYLDVPAVGALVAGVSFGSVGLGMGLAIGAAIGRPDRTTALVVGDGGFMMGGLPEFSTAVRNRLDLVTIVANDSSYGAEHVQLVRKGLNPELSRFDWPDFAALATALGGRGITVRDLDSLQLIPRLLESRNSPVLIDLRADPDVISSES